MQSPNSILSDIDKSLIKKWIISGASLGGGAALATSLANYLHHINKNTSSEDDDTLYIVRKKPQQEKAASLGGGLALTGGVMATLGSYALVKKLYEAYRKKEAQDELDKYQRAFFDVQGYEKADKKQIDKAASFRPMSVSETTMSLPVAVPLLVALGSGVIAKKMLDNAYPIVKKKTVAPKRIEIVDDTDEIAEKVASSIPDSCATELLYRTVGFRKEASSSLQDLIAATASGRIGEFKKAASEMGFYDALATVKGASAESVDPASEQIAITYLAKEASVAPQTAVLAAAEFAEFYPNFFKQACALDDDTASYFVKLAKLFGHAFKTDILAENGITYTSEDEAKTSNLTKQAAELAAGALLGSMLDREHSSEGEAISEESGKESGSSGSEASKPKFVYNSKKGLQLAKMLQNEDIIDKLMSA